MTTEPVATEVIRITSDSISHGGGHFSYSPAVFSFSWLHYLDFPAINLSQSGDTSGMTAERFDRDEIPISELFGFLAHEVIVQHIMGEDRKFFPYLPMPDLDG